MDPSQQPDAPGSGDGANIDGDVKPGRDFIGRDQHTHIERVERLELHVHTPPVAGAQRPPDGAAPENPFGLTGRLTDPAHYLVRQPFTDQLFHELRKGVSVSLVADSQMGKSSLLWHVHTQGPERLGRPAADVVYLNTQPLRNEDEFYEELCDSLGIETLRGNRLARKLRGRKVLLCLDEIEKMSADSQQRFTRDLRDELRGLADGPDAPLTLLIASRAPLDRLFPDSALSTSPLANLCLPLSLRPFTLDETRALVAFRLLAQGRTLPDAGVTAAWRASGGHPAQLQAALRELYRETHG